MENDLSLLLLLSFVVLIGSGLAFSILYVMVKIIDIIGVEDE